MPQSIAAPELAPQRDSAPRPPPRGVRDRRPGSPAARLDGLGQLAALGAAQVGEPERRAALAASEADAARRRRCRRQAA